MAIREIQLIQRPDMGVPETTIRGCQDFFLTRVRARAQIGGGALASAHFRGLPDGHMDLGRAVEARVHGPAACHSPGAKFARSPIFLVDPPDSYLRER